MGSLLFLWSLIYLIYSKPSPSYILLLTTQNSNNYVATSQAFVPHW